jgi:flagellar basal-body rod protein FlgB
MDHGNSVLMLKALDGLHARALVTAHNIANAGTPHYRPMRVTFEQKLQAAALRGADAVVQTLPNIEPASASGSGELRLDLELAAASTTSLRYGALIDVLNREMQLSLLAIKGNR